MYNTCAYVAKAGRITRSLRTLPWLAAQWLVTFRDGVCEDVRLLDVFYRGGETIRGFEKSGFGPRDLAAATNQDALGGKSYWAVNAEVRFPLPFVSEALGMSGAVFADAGSLFNATDAAKSLATLADDSSIRASAGASIIWKSPLGPLRFDYAFPLAYEDYDKLQRFRFGASTKF